MSYNQSRVEKSDGHLSKSGRPVFSGHQKGISGGGRGRAGGGSGGSSLNQPSLSANQSFKKCGNGQGGQPRVNPESVISDASTVSATGRAVQNGSSNKVPPAATKPVDMAILKTSIDPTKTPSSQAPTGTSGSAVPPSTPSKGDEGAAFSLQFGSISPGIVNGMQIPARTTSAPPNLDEQNHDQVHRESFKAPCPIPSGSKQQQPPLRKNMGSATGDTHPPVQLKRDIHPQFANAVRAPPPKPVTLPSSGISMAMPYPQPQVSMQFGGHGQQPIPMSLPIGNAPQVPQQMFVHNLQSHPLHPQAMIYQGQGLGFPPQICRQVAPQIVNLGIGIPNPQIAQQQGQFSGSRQTTVKITHPETHEELRLNKRTDVFTGGTSSGQRPPPNATPQSQPIPSFVPPHYFPQLQPHPYFFSTSAPMPTRSQVPGFSYPIGQSGQAVSIMNPPIKNSMPTEKVVPPLHGSYKPINPESPVITCGPKVGGPSVTISMPAGIAEAPKMATQPIEDILPHQSRENRVFSDGSLQQPETVSELQGTTAIPVFSQQPAKAASDVSTQRAQLGTSSAPAGVSGAVSTGTDGRKKESVRRSDPLKDQQKMSSHKDLQSFRQQQQVNVSASEADRNSSPVNISENESSESIESRHFPKNLHNDQDSKRTLVSTTAVNLLSHGDQSITTKARSVEVIKGKTGPAGSGSSGVILKKEELAEIPLICSDHVELPTDCKITTKAKDPVETSIISGLGTDGSMPNDLKSTRHQADHSSLEFEPSKAILEEIGQGKSEVLDATMLECSSAKVHPVPILAESYGGLKSVVSVKEKDNCVSVLENHIVYNGQDSKNQQLATSAAEKISEVKDAPVTFLAYSKAETVSFFPLVTRINNGPPSLNDTIDRSKTICSSYVGTSAPGASYPRTASIQGTLEAANKMGDVTGLPTDGPAHATLLKNKYTLESKRSKHVSGKKKKRREIMSKADAAGTSDLYNAYTGKEEKHQHISTSEVGDNSVNVDGENISADDPDKDVDTGEEGQQIKAELDDWEDASTPKLDEVKGVNDNDENEATCTKKYTRDFLLTFSEQCIDLPLDFHIGSDISNTLMSAPVSRVIDRNHNHSSGRIKDRLPGGSRGDCRMVCGMDDDKWIKGSGSFNLRDLRGDAGHLTSLNFPPGPGANHGVLKYPRGQPPTQHVGGILSGPMQSIAPQGGFARNSADADRWRTGNSRGLMPPPQTPMQVMHKAEKKYEIGKVSDEEEAKQRQLKAILNKLTPQNFEKLFEQVKEVNIDNTVTLAGVISQIFDKALTEPTFCEMYANFCFHLSSELPDFSQNDEKITFRRLLLNKCQEEFERGEKEQAEAERVEEEGEMKQSKEERERKSTKARRRMLGNIRLIGELYKKRMLTERIMHECIQKLLGQYQDPDEEDIEALCKLMSTIGEIIDHPKAKVHMDVYFDRMQKLSTNQKLSSRHRFMLRDSIDLRRNKWQQRRKIDGPKKIEEVHRDAAQERQSQVRSARGPALNSATRRGPSVDYGPRASTVLPSPSSQFGAMRGPIQTHGFGIQDVRLEERHPLEKRILSVPLTQRLTDDFSITLGPQGGLARGMSSKGQPLISNIPLLETPSIGNHRRIASGPNNYTSASERTSYSSRDSRSADQSSDRFSTSTVPAGQTLGSLDGNSSLMSDAKQLPDEVLREKSIATIREFYSAKDEQEVALCIKELNSPSSYPLMVSHWITDSFERKDMERYLLAILLVNLCKLHDGLLNQVQLTQGFEFVLSSLEEAICDAPKAPEFLGSLFAKVILENVIPLGDIVRLINEGGEKPGRLYEAGHASAVLGSILEIIRVEKGDPFVQDICRRSNLQLADFPQPH